MFKNFFKKRKQYTPPTDTISRARFAMSITSFLFVVILFVFLYRNFYQTIAQARIVIVLQQEVALQNVDIKAFNAVFAQHMFKQSVAIQNAIVDPFASSPIKVEQVDAFLKTNEPETNETDLE